MSTVMGSREQPRRKRTIRRIVIAAILLALIAEPIVMYKALQHERDDRRAAMERQMISEQTGND
jgi:hypothetical protein